MFAAENVTCFTISPTFGSRFTAFTIRVPDEIFVVLRLFIVEPETINAPILDVVTDKFVIVDSGASILVVTTSVPIVLAPIDEFALDTSVVTSNVPELIVIDTRFGIVELDNVIPSLITNVPIVATPVLRDALLTRFVTLKVPVLDNVETRLTIVDVGAFKPPVNAILENVASLPLTLARPELVIFVVISVLS